MRLILFLGLGLVTGVYSKYTYWTQADQDAADASRILFLETCRNNNCTECENVNITRGAFCTNHNPPCPGDPYKGCMGIWQDSAGHMVTQDNCCSDLRVLDLSDVYIWNTIVLVRVNGTSGNGSVYQQRVVRKPQTVRYPGLDAVLNDPNNVYNNYTCDNRCCKMAIVDRVYTGCINGDQLLLDGTCIYRGRPVNVNLSLCHNSTDDTCAIWEPCAMDVKGSAEFFWSLFVGNVILAIFTVMFFLYMKYVTDDYFAAFLLTTAVVGVCAYLNLCIVVPSYLDVWKGETQVPTDYITYQACIDHCSDSSSQYNQCGDQSMDVCNGYNEYCRSCRSHLDEWDDLSFVSRLTRGVVYAQVLLYMTMFLMFLFFEDKIWLRVAILVLAICLVGLAIYRIHFLAQIQFRYTELIILEYSAPIGQKAILVLCSFGVVFDCAIALIFFFVLLTWQEKHGYIFVPYGD